MIFFNKEGQAFEVQPGDVEAAFKQGLSPKEAKVPVVSTSGKSGLLDVAKLPRALASGWHLETEEEKVERVYGGQPISAGLAGVARGATLGLSDVVLTKSGLVDPEVLRGIQDANEAASLIGEVTG